MTVKKNYIIMISIFVFLLMTNSAIAKKPVYISDQKYKELQETAKKIKKDLLLEPNNAELHYELAHALLNTGNVNEALHEYNIAIGLDSENIDYKLGRANAYIEMKDYDNAIDDLNRIIKSDSNNISAYINLSIVYRDLKKYNESIDICKKAIELENSGRLYYHFATILMQKGDIDLARENFLKAMKMEQPFSHLYNLANSKLKELSEQTKTETAKEQ